MTTATPHSYLRTTSLAVVLLLAAGCSSSASTPPTQSATAVPSAVAPSLEPTTPSPAPSSPGRFLIALTNASAATVQADVHDESSRLIGAASGTPGDGASVPSDQVAIVNEGASTLRVTWSGPPCASKVVVVVDASAAKVTVVQPPCSGDSIALDRVLLLQFSGPIQASSVNGVLQSATDTAG